MAKTVLEVSGLTKQFGTFTAVDNISFSVKEGEIVGLLGPNGAGKTTTIQMLLGTLLPSAGSIVYFGKDFSNYREEILEKVNYMSAYARLPWRMTVWENLDVYARLYGVANRYERIVRLLAEFEVTDQKDKPVGSLSSGQATRVLLAKSFLNYPRLILLDEPTASLDPDVASRVRQFLMSQRREYTVSVIITSHNMAEVEEICDSVLFLNKGTIIAHDTPKGLAKQVNEAVVRLVLPSGIGRVHSHCKKQGWDATMERQNLTVRMPEQEIPSLLMHLSDSSLKYDEISIDKPKLEDYFLSISKGKI